MRCVRCGYRLRDFEDECPACTTARIGPEDWVCLVCGGHNRPVVASCTQCGAPRDRRSVTVQAKLATFGQRVFAQLLDAVAVLISVAILVLAATVIRPEWSLKGSEAAGLTIDRFALLGAMAIGFLYHTVPIAAWGATLGKLVFGLRVVATTGGPLGWWRAVVRTVGLLASLATLGLVFLWVPRDRRKQGLHDKLAGTIVVKV